MTFNIRYGSADDGENSWSNRHELVIDSIKRANVDLLGLQEALREQLDELDHALTQYCRVGVGREAAGGGEYSAIYFRRSRFDLQDAGTFWLSATPQQPGSATWGNSLPRVCTWVRLLDRASGERIVHLNTHWDHQSQAARLESAKLMAERIDQLASSDVPVVVTGDFNAAPENPATRHLAESASLRDSFTIANPDEKKLDTFNGFGNARMSAKIDYVFVSDHWKVRRAAIDRTRPGERYVSDHYPVTAEIVLADETDATSR
jgi:endonuclease/exonuclease/phosphatase family metal-dependent hydrolase